MANPGTEQLLISSIMHNPTVLLQKDRYNISMDDFSTKMYKQIFYVIYNMVKSGAYEQISVAEIENWLSENSTSKIEYEQKNSRQLLIDALADAEGLAKNVESNYKLLKKENLIEKLQKSKYFKSEKFYIEGVSPVGSEEQNAVNEQYNALTTADILNTINQELILLKSEFDEGGQVEEQYVSDGLEDMILGLEEHPEIGAPLQGHLYNHIVGGALPRKFYLRSGGSGVGKTRLAVADAAFISMPVRYNWSTVSWEQKGLSEKVLFIITEQDMEQVQRMLVAYVSGVNEATIKRGLLTDVQKKIVRQAIKVIEHYKDNFILVRVPDPCISTIEQIVREKVLTHKIEYVFYDYIFESPALYNEFRGMNLRTDQLLFAFSDALKKLATELDIFVISSTQVNSKSDDSKNIRNEAALAGARAVINKADVGSIMVRPSREEMAALAEVASKFTIEPNVITDIFKVRDGEFTDIRIWSHIDLGIMRREDLFVTNASLTPIQIGYEKAGFYITESDLDEAKRYVEVLNRE